jgi:hypothetical protein
MKIVIESLLFKKTSSWVFSILKKTI